MAMQDKKKMLDKLKMPESAHQMDLEGLDGDDSDGSQDMHADSQKPDDSEDQNDGGDDEAAEGEGSCDHLSDDELMAEVEKRGLSDKLPKSDGGDLSEEDSGSDMPAPASKKKDGSRY